tara:strand:+ start:7054 stop:8754 length:1701 start_codon:yes stop_codon:yes gene_type:complete
MEEQQKLVESATIKTFRDFADKADFSFLNNLNPDPQSSNDGNDHIPREIFSGHFVPVKPTAISSPKYIAHGKNFFNELGLCHELKDDKSFCSFFTGNIVSINEIPNYGWATGYALSIYGSEYIIQCPFKTGNAYGDGRAISIYEGVFNNKRWEMQLKGGGPTPYCRGADGRAVLRSSIREFLAQEFMNSLKVPTSRSLILFASEKETVMRPWYGANSNTFEPDILVENPVAITTRAAPSFLRVGQIELFSRRVKNNSHPNAYKELEMIIKHLIQRNYEDDIGRDLAFLDQVIELAFLYRNRLISLVSNWIRVGYCQGNFNSDNCALGGYTLDYGPFGFCELFEPGFQPWTGGGEHFSFLNQPKAAEINFKTFCNCLIPLFKDNRKLLDKLAEIENDFSDYMKREMELMWQMKLGLSFWDTNLVESLFKLMLVTKVDYTMFFRRLSEIPEDIGLLKESFYKPISEDINLQWTNWLKSWKNNIHKIGDSKEKSALMKSVNPQYTWREWLVVPAYENAEKGDYHLLNELQEVFDDPYKRQIKTLDKKFDSLKPIEFFNKGGISYYSCSS